MPLKVKDVRNYATLNEYLLAMRDKLVADIDFKRLHMYLNGTNHPSRYHSDEALKENARYVLNSVIKEADLNYTCGTGCFEATKRNGLWLSLQVGPFIESLCGDIVDAKIMPDYTGPLSIAQKVALALSTEADPDAYIKKLISDPANTLHVTHHELL